MNDSLNKKEHTTSNRTYRYHNRTLTRAQGSHSLLGHYLETALVRTVSGTLTMTSSIEKMLISDEPALRPDEDSCQSQVFQLYPGVVQHSSRPLHRPSRGQQVHTSHSLQWKSRQYKNNQVKLTKIKSTAAINS